MTVQVSAGLLFGIAYLAKAVALPFSCILIIAVGILWVVCQQTPPMRALRSLAMTFLGLFLIAGPWILLLSLKYERPVFSTSAEINHSIMGPSHSDGKHPTFREFHVPEQGRVTSWEDPSPAKYTHWSPLESSKNVFHQLKLMVKNAQAALFALKVFDWLGIGLICVIFGFCFHMPWRENLRLHRWRWSAVFVGCLVAVYLPVYGGDMRYYLAAYPFLLGGSLGFVGYLVRDPSNQTKVLSVLAVGFVAVSFLFPLSLIPTPNEKPGYQAAKILRDKLQAIHITGPIASVCESKDIAYYTAFLMEIPYHGNYRAAQTVEDVQTSSAKIMIVERGTVVDANLKKDKNFIPLEEDLFDSLGRDDIPDANVYINTKL
jgi:hypothetical protein